MREKIIENKKIIILLASILIVVIAAFFLLKENDPYKDMSDEAIINEVLDNMDSLDSFEMDFTTDRVSKDTETVPNFSNEGTGKQDLKNKILHVKSDSITNGEERFNEYYYQVVEDTYKMYDYNLEKWSYYEEEVEGDFYNFDFIKTLLENTPYTLKREDNKIIIESTYQPEDYKDDLTAGYLDPEATYTYKIVIEDGYIIEFLRTEESNYVSDETIVKYYNFNEAMNIVIPDEVLELEE